MELVRLLKFPIFKEDGGTLVVFEEGLSEIPFLIKRVFNVSSEKESVRGMHAHRLCSQILVCSSGSIEVTCDDSIHRVIYTLDKPNYGLLVPSGIWAEQKYLEHNTTMTVICDRLYESEDYISNYADFKVFVSSLN